MRRGPQPPRGPTTAAVPASGDREAGCDHEPETEAHRAFKSALARSLEERLGSEGWRVFVERRLENGRRPDVMIVHRDPRGSTGGPPARIAFEAQYSPIGQDLLQRRSADYARAGVEDLWLVGWAAERPEVLPRTLPPGLCEELAHLGHRVILAGVEPLAGDGRSRAWFAEALLADGERDPRGRWITLPAPPGSRPARRATRGGRIPIWHWVLYEAAAIRPDPATGTIRTPADDLHEKVRNALQLSQARDALLASLRRLLRAKARAASRTDGRATGCVRKPARHRNPIVEPEEWVPPEPSTPRRLSSSYAASASPTQRDFIRGDIGEGWFEILSVPGLHDDALYADPLLWKYAFVRSILGHRAPGEPFPARDVAARVLARFPHAPGPDGRRRAAQAVLDFLELLANHGELARLAPTEDENAGPLHFALVERERK